MFKWIVVSFLAFVQIVGLEAGCLMKLDEMQLEDLWDELLTVQVSLCADQEQKLLAGQDWWLDVAEVLDIGSGNGEYLMSFAREFPDKKYVGCELNPERVAAANRKVAAYAQNVQFVVGDAQVANEEFFNRFDLVIFRLTLQHLSDPFLALQQAYHYLKPGGHLFILDSYDRIRCYSHPISLFEKGIEQLNQKKNKPNRLITLQILQLLNKGEGALSDLFKLEHTSLDETGELFPSAKQLIVEGENGRRLYAKLVFVFSEILKKGYEISIDQDLLFEEVQSYLSDPNAWIRLGVHQLILQKS